MIGYARDHPNDKRIPESLYLTLRMMHYGCYHGYGGETPDQTTPRRSRTKWWS
jgi:hypothetical protein